MKRVRYWRRWQATVRVTSVGDVPERIGPRRAVLVGSPTRDKWLVFDCPCGNGHRVMINLDPENLPRWRVSSDVPLTVTPSVDERSGAGHCHYFVRDGRVIWAKGAECR